ncbi:MAG: FixH family protein [Deltaproteobacteria bacterium]|jgi:hypothetical protein|nr:FixH family protein [Deltaproteobacteria bacterium]MBW2543468.1 FixH family protein [Deltaproteobacteria bacterium]
MRDSDPKAGLPWYRFFWPWFIVVLISASMAGAVATVVIAYSNQDSLVSEAWYESGTRINRRLESETNALRRSIRAELRIDDTTGEVRVELTGEGVASVRELVLHFSHPTRAASDRSVSLSRPDAGSFRGQLDARLSGRWYASLTPPEAASTDAAPVPEAAPAAADAWRLSTTLYLPSAEPLIMGGSG